MTQQQFERRVQRLRRYLSLGAVARELGVPFARVQAVVDRQVGQPVQVQRGARGRICACGAPAVDVWRGVPRCAACLCPGPTAADLAAERWRWSTRGEGNLARECAGEVGLRGGSTLRDLRRALDRAMARHGIPLVSR